MKALDKKVWGYDKTPSPITEHLQNQDINVRFDINLERIKNEITDKTGTIIVYTPAVKPHEHEELDYFLQNNFQIVKRARLLAMVTENSICLAVAGTHGKTTTSAILGHILKVADFPATSFLGGIAENYHSNLILNGTKYTVVEADEYDRSFLQLDPDYACVTAMDPDHLDIYETEESFEEGFESFTQKVKNQVFVEENTTLLGLKFGFDNNTDYQAKNIRIIDGVYHFEVKTPQHVIQNLELSLPGKHNILNALAAIALAESIGVSVLKIKQAINTFSGVSRRFTYRIKTKESILIDDYAHHPTELQALYETIRALYPKEKVSIIFQPHTYSRTNDFMQGFVKTLSQFDEIFVLPIYAAREHPINGITSKKMVDNITLFNTNCSLLQPNNLLQTYSQIKNRIVLMVGAGDIGEMITELVTQLKSTSHA
jgi:UDP-N-acetylmuramate--alanine ligase